MSEILQRWRAGEGLPGVLAIDGHAHVGDWPHGANFASIKDAAEGAVAAMDANGVDAACVLSGGYMFGASDYRLGNDALLDLCARVPDRLIGFAHANPNDDRDAMLAELDRVERAGLRCIKLLNSYQQAYPGDGPNLMALYEFAAERNMLILNHFWSEDEIRRIAPAFPTVDFIQGHAGGSAAARDLPNVHGNLWSLGTLGFIERGIANAGAGKVIFGSDAFMNPMSVGIGLAVYADVSDEEKRLILGLNMARLLKKVGALPARIEDDYDL
jgi:predicted TIM-barrel fold metal-dependent hydrolase